jgi:hypothetical protein
MTVSRNRDVNQTPDLPGFRVFGAGFGGQCEPFDRIFNALKNRGSGWLAPIFNALKIYEMRDSNRSNRGGPAMQPPK